jgi:transcription antitermination factor NusB
MGKRHRARELAMQVLFHLEFAPDSAEDGFNLVCEHFSPSQSIKDFSKMLILGVWSRKAYLDGLISRSSKNWRLERMSRVDRNILRLGVYEMLYLDDIPPKVSIDEAVEMGKRFGTEDSGPFINGILDNIYNTLKQEGKLGENN